MEVSFFGRKKNLYKLDYSFGKSKNLMIRKAKKGALLVNVNFNILISSNHLSDFIEIQFFINNIEN